MNGLDELLMSEFLENVSPDFASDINKKLYKEGIVYNSQVYPLVLNPFVFNKELESELNNVSKKWDDLMNHLGNYIRSEKELQKEKILFKL